MAKICDKCGLDRHRPDCPEMFWPDGRPRGMIHPDARARLSGRLLSEPLPFHPGKHTPPHYDSPLAEELKGIFGGIKPKSEAP